MTYLTNVVIGDCAKSDHLLQNLPGCPKAQRELVRGAVAGLAAGPLFIDFCSRWRRRFGIDLEGRTLTTDDLYLHVLDVARYYFEVVRKVAARGEGLRGLKAVPGFGGGTMRLDRGDATELVAKAFQPKGATTVGKVPHVFDVLFGLRGGICARIISLTISKTNALCAFFGNSGKQTKQTLY